MNSNVHLNYILTKFQFSILEQLDFRVQSKMRKKILVPIVIMLGLLITAYVMFGNPIITYHNYQLKQSIRTISEPEVTLNEIIPFAWDTVYTFSPYTSRSEIEEIIGFKSSAVQETVSEGMVQLLFVKGSSVVASVCGYAENLGYRVDFVDKVNFKDRTLFNASMQDGVMSLTER